ncbi:hypothetical protein N9A72_00565, partial [bacterium]|nr:hypothetical protein [bacterium]
YECKFKPNFDQTIKVIYDYVFLDGGQDILYINGVKHEIGSDGDAFWGNSGKWTIDVFANDECRLVNEDDDYCLDSIAIYRKQYIDPPFLLKECRGKVSAISRWNSVLRDFKLTIPFPLNWRSLKPQDELQEELVGIADAEIFNRHLVNPSINLDYDDNPEVKTWLEVLEEDGDTVTGLLHAKNISPSIKPFIIDRHPPEIEAYLSKSIFSPRLKQSTDIEFTVTDNLIYLLKDVSLKIYDGQDNLVQVLYDTGTYSPATKTFSWDGKGSSDYNGGEIVEDGIYTYKIKAWDRAGNPNEFSDEIIVDNIPPEISGESLVIIPASHPHPNTFTLNDDKIQISYNLQDNLSESVDVRLIFSSGSTVFIATNTYNNTTSRQAITFNWDGKDKSGNFLPDGVYTATLLATDLAGNAGGIITLPSFEIDRTPPVVTTLYVDNFIFTPDDGPDGYQDTVTLHYTLTEEAYISCYIEDVLGRNILDFGQDSELKIEGTYPWNGKVNGDFVSDGSYVFRIKTIDDVGNEALSSIPVIKNQIPAQLVFQVEESTSIKVSNIVTIKGIALDPGIDDPTDFKWYKIWYREGENIDFSLPENDPLNPGLGFWSPIPVPAYNQNALDADYPNSNISYRAVANTTLATWDTTGLTSGSHYTLLLVTEDESNHSSYDFREVEVDQSFDTTSPEVSISNPTALSEFNVTSEDSKLEIVYSLTQDAEKKANVSVEIFKMSDDGINYGPIVWHKNYLYINEAETIYWNGKNHQKQWVDDGRYRIWLIARDADDMGVDVADVDIMVNVVISEPLKIVKFEPSNSSVASGDVVTINYELSKETNVTIKVYDTSDTLVQTLVDNEVTPGLIEGTTTWTAGSDGLYICKINATATDSEVTEDNASFFIAVTGGGTGTNEVSIAYPEEGAIVKGESNFNWSASADGEHYPPQPFSATVQAHGIQSWTQSSSADFNAGTPVDVLISNDEIKLRFNQSWEQTSNADFNEGTENNIDVFSGSFYRHFTDEALLEEQTIYNCDGGTPYSLYCSMAQSFRAKIRCYLTAVSIYLCRYNADPQAITIKLQEKIGTSWQTRKTRIFTPPFRGAWSKIIWDTPFPLSKFQVNDSYRIFSPQQGNRTYFFTWFWQSIWKAVDDVYPYGNSYINEKKDNYRDQAFKLWERHYIDSGDWLSRACDCSENISGWGKLETVYDDSSGGSILFKTMVSSNGSDWDEEIAIGEDGQINSALKRYIKVHVYLTGKGNYQTPIVHSFTVYWAEDAHFISQVYDCGTDISSWGNFEVSQNKPSGTNIEYATQTRSDGENWNTWRSATPGQPVRSPVKRYIRWKADLTATTGSVSPTLYQVTIRSNWSPKVNISGVTWYNHIWKSEQSLPELLPIPSDREIARTSPPFTVNGTVGNPVAAYLPGTTEPHPNVKVYIDGDKVKAVSDKWEEWETADDQELLASNGCVAGVNYEFNNSTNPWHFVTKREEEVVISDAYPNVNMYASDSIKNKYTFWREEGAVRDNPYVNVNSDIWNINLIYPDGSDNNDLIIVRNMTKASNINQTGIDDDYGVELAVESTPKVFVELKGNTSTLAQGFNSYSIFYRKADESTWKSIPVSNPNIPVLSSETLAYWDVTGLNGDYVVKLVVVDNSGANELTRNIAIGTSVPGYQSTCSPPNYVVSPYNKGVLAFQPDSLEEDTVVTITPMRLSDTGIELDPNMPHPIGAFYKLQPKGIPFRKDANGVVFSTATAFFSVRFTYEELKGINPDNLAIYHVKDDGTLESIDVRVVYDENGNKIFDEDEIVTVTSPVTEFSYYLVIPKVTSPIIYDIPSPANKKSINVCGEAELSSTVKLFLNGAEVGETILVSTNTFSIPVSLTSGCNMIYATATRWFNNFARVSETSNIVKVIYDSTPPEITNLIDEPDPFTPNDDKIRDKVKISYTLSEDALVWIEVYDGDTLVRTIKDDSFKPYGKDNYYYWDGKDDEGLGVNQGVYTYRICARDVAGNDALNVTGDVRLSYATMPPPAPMPVYPLTGNYVTISTPTFKLYSDETVERWLKYKIEISTDNFESLTRSFDQSVSTCGWITNESEPYQVETAIKYNIHPEDSLEDAIYQWKVSCTDDIWWSDISSTQTFTLDTTPPSVITPLSPKDGEILENPKPEFNWTEVEDNLSGLECYEFQVDNNVDFLSPEFKITTSSSIVTPIDNLAIDDYFWRIRAKDKAGNWSLWTSTYSFKKINAPPTVPTLVAPADGDFVTTEKPTFKLVSSDLDNHTLKYRIELSTNNFETKAYAFDESLDSNGWSDGEYMVSEPLKDGIYKWQGVAFDGIDWSKVSSTSTFILDTSSPVIKVALPKEGDLYVSNKNILDINFDVSDLDSAPLITTYLLDKEEGVKIEVSNGDKIEPAQIDDGFWDLVIKVKDWVGNISSSVVKGFEV